MPEFREAVDRITGGLEKRNRAINPDFTTYAG
jgi:hypothetical protein